MKKEQGIDRGNIAIHLSCFEKVHDFLQNIFIVRISYLFFERECKLILCHITGTDNKLINVFSKPSSPFNKTINLQFSFMFFISTLHSYKYFLYHFECCLCTHQYTWECIFWNSSVLTFYLSVVLHSPNSVKFLI